ncbi:hypothetical protein [Azospirillum largimobile]
MRNILATPERCGNAESGDRIFRRRNAGGRAFLGGSVTGNGSGPESVTGNGFAVQKSLYFHGPGAAFVLSTRRTIR